MAGRRVQRGKKGAGRRYVKRTKRNMRKAGGSREWAEAKQTLALPNDQANNVYHLDDINLSQFDRLTNIARNYQFFRITKVEMKFQPYADTFQTTGNISVPYFYHVINKSNSLDAGSFDKLRDAGAKSIRFDDKTVNVVWRPTVATANILSQPLVGPPTVSAFSSYRTAPWLATNQVPASGALAWTPSTVPHNGLLYGVEQDFLPGGTLSIYGVQITVHAQFKKPLTYENPGSMVTSSVKKVIEAKADVVPSV